MSGDDAEPTDGSDAAIWLTALVEAEAAEPPPAKSRGLLMARLTGRERYAPFCEEVASAFGLTVDAVREAFGQIADPAAWETGAWPGARVLRTPQLEQTGTLIARLPAGSGIPAHHHTTHELTYVLDGALLEDDTRRVGPGEQLAAAPGTSHAITVSSEGGCLVVFSSCGDAGPRAAFRGDGET